MDRRIREDRLHQDGISRDRVKKLPQPYFMTYAAAKDKNSVNPREDKEYIRQLYPQEAKRYLRVIVEVLDRMDVKESYIYDEYPDYVAVNRLTEVVLRAVPLEQNMTRESQRSLVKVLLLEEIHLRRSRQEEI